jgi:hypothetical protein
MNVEVGAEAAQFPEKEYIIGNAVAVRLTMMIKKEKDFPDPQSNTGIDEIRTDTLYCSLFSSIKHLDIT